MKTYQHQLSSIINKEKKLIEQKNKLIAHRKQAINDLISKFDLLAATDEMLAGIFLEAQAALQNKSQKIKEWELLGARFRQPKKQNGKTIEATD